MTGDWYVISTRHAAEEAASEWIARVMKGLTYYPAARRSNILVAQGVKPIASVSERAAFYGYVFSRFDYTPDWDILRRCPHIHGLLKIFSHEETVDGIPYPVYIPWQLRDVEIADLHAREQAGEFNAEDATNTLVKKLIGQPIKIPYGTFMGYTGKVKRIENGLVTLTLALMKNARPTRLSFKFEDLFTPTDW